MPQKDLRPSASYLWLEKDDSILLHQRANTGYMDGMYQMPAGHVDPMEVPSETVIRESLEEVGITLQSANIAICMVMSRVDESVSYYDFFFRATKWTGEPKIMEPHKCSAIGWFKLDALPDNIIPYNRDVIELVQKGVSYAEESKNS